MRPHRAFPGDPPAWVSSSRGPHIRWMSGSSGPWGPLPRPSLSSHSRIFPLTTRCASCAFVHVYLFLLVYMYRILSLRASRSSHTIASKCRAPTKSGFDLRCSGDGHLVVIDAKDLSYRQRFNGSERKPFVLWAIYTLVPSEWYMSNSAS
jgi:hypothetical protein